ncbi:hypothetical protein CEXT_570971 [Caerostris extrusa]|uniref:Uncharacterized protein n=1 Tax=Caerostris extrusa TaxID=172846 RepID=A0AAV4S126_CAEEX|nr:hypothetical protein CEXT_570971 [Caerostris extrusa]
MPLVEENQPLNSNKTLTELFSLIRCRYHLHQSKTKPKRLLGNEEKRKEREGPEAKCEFQISDYLIGVSEGNSFPLFPVKHRAWKSKELNY